MIEVKYIDHMGSDLTVVNAARVSFNKKSDWIPKIHNGEKNEDQANVTDARERESNSCNIDNQGYE